MCMASEEMQLFSSLLHLCSLQVYRVTVGYCAPKHEMMGNSVLGKLV